MTAKEALAEWVGGLSEADAAAYLEKVQPEAREAAECPPADDPLLRFLARTRDRGPSMTDAQWDAFAENLEADRLSYRKRWG